VVDAINLSANQKNRTTALTLHTEHSKWISVTAIIFAVTLIISQSSYAADPKNGAYVFKIAGCTGCHTREDDRKKSILLAGGRSFKTPFGTYYSPNITPDQTGLGGWDEDDFKNALRHGVTPDGSNYFPVFPYVSYTKMSNTDISDLWAYIKTLPPVSRKNQDHDVNIIFGSRFLMFFWKLLNFDEGPQPSDITKDEAWNRGRYLVDALGHCTECHTPRNLMGALKTDMYLAGTAVGPDGDAVPNITPDMETGIGKWLDDEYDSLLSMGMLPDGDFVGGSMGEVVENTESLTNNDRIAIINYLKSVQPISHKFTVPAPKQ
jgi:mono/diheme cytochrome c family protein